MGKLYLSISDHHDCNNAIKQLPHGFHISFRVRIIGGNGTSPS